MDRSRHSTLDELHGSSKKKLKIRQYYKNEDLNYVYISFGNYYNFDGEVLNINMMFDVYPHPNTYV